MDVKYVKYRAR